MHNSGVAFIAAAAASSSEEYVLHEDYGGAVRASAATMISIKGVGGSQRFKVKKKFEVHHPGL